MIVSHSLQKIVAGLTSPAGQFPMAPRMIDGVEQHVFTATPQTLPAFFEMCRQHGDTEFVICNDQRLSFEDVHEAATRVAKLLNSRGIGPGDRVAIAMRNRPEWVYAYMGSLMAGATVAPMNSWWTSDELAYGLDDCDASLAFVDASREKRIQDSGSSTPIISAGRFGEQNNPLTRLMGEQTDGLVDSSSIVADDPATIMYTSGSTGHPKGAASTHRAVLTTIFGWTALGISMKVHEGTLEDTPDTQPGIIATVPFFHVTGCYAQFLLSIVLGRKLVIMHHWDGDDASMLIQKERISTFNSVPTMTLDLIEAANSGRYDLSSLQEISAGGAARPPDQVALTHETFSDCRLSLGYGLTETNAIGAINVVEDYLNRPTSVGVTIPPLVDIQIRDSHGKQMNAGEHGEVCIKSAANFREYLNKPVATAETIEQGWVKTGDIGYFDDEGFLHIVDRIKDIVIRGGENISCLEVEAALSAHPAIREAAVFSVSDPRLGEMVGATVMCSDPAVAEGDVKRFLDDRLAKYKIPEWLYMIPESLPRLASGKIDKRKSREILLSAKQP